MLRRSLVQRSAGQVPESAGRDFVAVLREELQGIFHDRLATLSGVRADVSTVPLTKCGSRIDTSCPDRR